MTLPFVWGGALLAIGVLVGGYLAFALILKLVDRAALEVRDSILPGVVDGVRRWADVPDTGDDPGRVSSPAAPVQHVHRVR